VDRVIDLTTNPPTDRLAPRVALSFSSSAAVPSGDVRNHEAGPDASTVPPWQRWLREDVDAARALAQELLVWGGGLPSFMDQAAALGQDDPDPAILALLGRLEAFHSAMRTLLGDVGASTGTATGATPPATRATHLHMMIRHCRRRLTELELLQVEVAERRSAGQVTVPAAARTLPGEFLG
jgi:hypothetical protein